MVGTSRKNAFQLNKKYSILFYNKIQNDTSSQSSTLLCFFRIGSSLVSVHFWEGEFPSLARPLRSPVFCSTSSCQTINTPLPPFTPISPTATHTVSDSRVPKMVQYHSTPPSRGLPNDCLFLAPLRPLSRFSLRITVLPRVYETLVNNPPYYYEYKPYTHPISTSLPSGLPFPTSHPLRVSATRPQSEASVVRTLLGLAQTQPLPPATLGMLARKSTLLRFRLPVRR